MGQQVFWFLEGIKILEAIQKRHHVPLLNLNSFEARAEQLPILEELLKQDLHTVFAQETGGGKSASIIAKFLQLISRGQRVVFLTTKKLLVGQTVDYVLQYSTLPKESVVGLDGEAFSAKARGKLHATCPPFIVSTYGAFIEDIQNDRVDWKNIGAICFDELHHAVGDDAARKCLLNCKNEHPNVVRYGVSALPAKGALELGRLLDVDFERKFFFLVEADQSNRRVIIERTIYLELEEPLKGYVRILEEETCKIWNRIIGLSGEPQKRFTFSAFRYPESQELPTFEEREKSLQAIQNERARLSRILNDDLRKEREKELNKLHSLWAEIGLLTWLTHCLAEMGCYSFLEDFAYRFAWHFITPRRTSVREFERKKRKPPRFFERNVVSNKRVWSIFALLSRNTPFEALCKRKDRSWNAVYRDAFGEAPPSKQAEEIARVFFAKSLEWFAANYKDENPKAAEIQALLEQYPREKQTGRVIIFAHSRRDVEYEAARINALFSPLGYRAVWASGVQTAAKGRERDKGIAEYNDDAGAANVVATTDYLREGVDIRSATLSIEKVVTSSNPIKRVQGRGRLVRSGGIGYSYHIVIKGREQQRLLISYVRERHINRVLRRKARRLSPGQRMLFDTGEATHS